MTWVPRTLITLITSRTKSRSRWRPLLGRTSPIRTWVWGLPRSSSTTWSIVPPRSTALPSIETISSPSWMPALSPGEPGMGLMTEKAPLCISTSTPMPPYSPSRSSSNSALSLDSRYWEWGSRESTIPWIESRASSS